MINKTELRIGNWALYPHTIHEPFQITEPRHIELAYLLKPIPLTPEILEACGFIEGRSDYSTECIVYINGIRLFQHEGNLYSLYAYNDEKAYVSCLHELQNLYFALTGSELSVNLDKVKV